MKTRLLFLTLACTLLAAPALQAANVKLPRGTLSRKELKELFSDQTVNSITATKGRLAVTYYSPMGEVHQLRKGIRRNGTWRVTRKGRLCIQMEGYREKCRIVVRDGEVYKKYIVKKNGDHQHILTYLSFTEGNPNGL